MFLFKTFKKECIFKKRFKNTLLMTEQKNKSQLLKFEETFLSMFSIILFGTIRIKIFLADLSVNLLLVKKH